ncbi:MAG: lytic transglycosylase domain-containing protein [bacterium]|nr:lytic transglycosylase domain-containing protein [bacterium]
MDRIWLALLIACALIASALPIKHAPAPAAAAAAAAAGWTGTVDRADRGLPAVSSAAPPESDSQDESRSADVSEEETIVAQILQRLAVRHTALAERERIRLARTIAREARDHRLDPDLVMAVIEVESAGYHLAQSRVGARGLMQLLPATGRELADKLDIEWIGPETLFDPFINVRLGTAYLRELANRYDGDINLALAAYNWGPGRIDGRLRRGAAVPSRYIQQVRRATDRYAVASADRP